MLLSFAIKSESTTDLVSESRCFGPPCSFQNAEKRKKAATTWTGRFTIKRIADTDPVFGNARVVADEAIAVVAGVVLIAHAFATVATTSRRTWRTYHN